MRVDAVGAKHTRPHLQLRQAGAAGKARVVGVGQRSGYRGCRRHERVRDFHVARFDDVSVVDDGLAAVVSAEKTRAHLVEGVGFHVDAYPWRDPAFICQYIGGLLPLDLDVAEAKVDLTAG